MSMYVALPVVDACTMFLKQRLGRAALLLEALDSVGRGHTRLVTALNPVRDCSLRHRHWLLLDC